MTTDECILEEMLERATNPAKENVDELAVQMFCMVVRSNVQLVHKAQEMLVSKIRSNDVTESTRAIGLLEECMSKCGDEFQDEAAKFRFLNDLIRLVSKKYQGPDTPPAIKQRIMECLLLWTTEFPRKTKIREAYDMLRKEGVVEPGSTSSAIAKRETILGIDGDMFSKLVNSNDPENYKRANLLIQYRVQQDARRTELSAQHRCVLQEVQETVKLLNEMLDTYKNDGCTSADASDTMILMRELYLSCKKHKPILQRLPELIENTNDDLIADTLEANDLLQAVMSRYKSTVVHPAKATEAATAARAKDTPATSNKDLLELLGDIISTSTLTSVTNGAVGGDTPQVAAPIVAPNSAKPTATTTGNSIQHSLDELHEIFENATNTESSTATANNILNTFDLLQPVNIFPSPTKETTARKSSLDTTDEAEAAMKSGFRQLRDIDQLSEQLFEENLQNNERLRTFKKDPEKITLNDLAKEKSNPEAIRTPPTLTPKRSAKAAMERLEKSLVQLSSKIQRGDEMLTKRSPTVSAKSTIQQDQEMLTERSAPVSAKSASQFLDDVQMLSDTPETDETPVLLASNNDELPVLNDKVDKNELVPSQIKPEALPFKHLSEITIDLEFVKPKSEPARILTDDDDIKITLNFTEDRPSRHVSVIVISVWNKSSLSLKDFQFEASVKKPSKVRLLPPTDNTMLPFKPFRPPPPINQVMLLLNPTGKAVDVTCIMGYKLGDDPDPIKDSIVAKDIPFVE